MTHLGFTGTLNENPYYFNPYYFMQMVYVVTLETADTHQKLTLFSPLCSYSNTGWICILSINTTQVMNSSDWLARRSFKWSRELFNSEQPKRNKKIFKSSKFWTPQFLLWRVSDPKNRILILSIVNIWSLLSRSAHRWTSFDHLSNYVTKCKLNTRILQK